MKVVRSQGYPMGQVGGPTGVSSDVGLWFSPERPSHVAMTPALTNPHKRGCGQAGGAEEGKLNRGINPVQQLTFNTPLFNRTS